MHLDISILIQNLEPFKARGTLSLWPRARSAGRKYECPWIAYSYTHGTIVRQIAYCGPIITGRRHSISPEGRRAQQSKAFKPCAIAMGTD